MAFVGPISRSLLLFIVVIGMAATACKEGPAPSVQAGDGTAAPTSTSTRASVRLEGETMGTTYHITVVVPSSQATAVEGIKPDIDRALEKVNDQMSTYRPQSELSRFNAHQADTPFEVSAATARVVERALEVGKLTDGAFDVTLGPLIALWGFDRNGRRTSPPSAEEIEAARARVGLDRVSVEGYALRKSRPDVEVNLSGIAKGHGVDVVYDLLAARQLTDYMIEIGGEVRVRGLNAKGEAWTIGVNVPKSDADPTAVLRAVPLSGGAMATSGNYRNFFEAGGRRYGHIIDPRTAAPVSHSLVSATILAPDCTTADALATAALVLGEEKMRDALASFPGTSAMFVHGGGDGTAVADFKVSFTDGFTAPR